MPKGKDVGGTFKNVPLCQTRDADRLRDHVSRRSARRFRRRPTRCSAVRRRGQWSPACTNPAALGGGSGGAARVLVGRTAGRSSGTTPPKPWVTPEQPIEHAVGQRARPADGQVRDERERDVPRSHRQRRTRPIRASTTSSATSARAATSQANWGLHLIDVNLAMGNLVDIVGQQAKAYSRRSSAGLQACDVPGVLAVGCFAASLQGLPGFDAGVLPGKVRAAYCTPSLCPQPLRPSPALSPRIYSRPLIMPLPRLTPMRWGHLRHRGARLRVRHLRSPDGAARRRPCHR